MKRFGPMDMAIVYALHFAQDASLKLEFGFYHFAKHCLVSQDALKHFGMPLVRVFTRTINSRAFK